MFKDRIAVTWVAVFFFFSCLPFLAAINYDIIDFDDYSYTFCNKQITGAFSLSTLLWMFHSTGESIWMPVTWLSYLLDFKVWGGSTHAMHAVNVLGHGLNALLLFYLLLTLFSSSGVTAANFSDRRLVTICGLGALLWAVHPLRVESVAWVASRKDVLFLFFELAAMILWLKRLDFSDKAMRGMVYYWGAIACLILSGMSKPAAMTFPLLAGLLELLKKKGTVRWGEYALPVFIACVIGAIGMHAQRAGGAMEALAHVPLLGRLLNAVAAMGIYCWKSLCPTGLAVECLNRWPELPRFWFQGLLICGGYGAVLAVLFYRLFGQNIQTAIQSLAAKKKIEWNSLFSASTESAQIPLLVFVGLSFFLLAVAPTLGISNFGLHAFADRFTYLPAIGFSIVLVGGLNASASKGSVRVGLAAGACAGIIFAAMTAHQVRYWENEKKLFGHTLEIDGDKNICASGIVGCYYYEVEHDLERARHYLGKSINENPRPLYPTVMHPIYVKVLAEAGDTTLAKIEAQKYIAIIDHAMNGDFAKKNFSDPLLTPSGGLILYAIISFEEGQIDLAKEHVTKFEQLNPDTTWAAYLMGKIALKEGNKKEAIRYWKKSVADKSSFVRHRFLEPEIRRLEQEQP